MKTSYDLAGKVVLITGGTGGIGSATARDLLSRGAQVAIVDLDPATPDIASRMSPTAAIGLVADVTDRDALERAVAAVVERFGRLDVAIANAGILSPGSTLRTMPLSQVDALLAVNINGVVNTVTASLDQVIAHRGQIVLISSVFAFLNGMGAIPYAMSKAAVEQLGRGLRVELAAHGVSTTTAYFSLIETGMVKRGVDDDPSVVQLMATLPKPLLKRLSPEVAARAITEGLTHRSPRVMAPARWKPLSALRGVIGPALDTRLTTEPRTQAALANLDAPHTYQETP
ncbi:MAG: SDR family NAD(P)-dependent oxidoreductase [Actinomycetota bacterium]|nr:SDR family NAD(P)-dependent oxidoreductase [Actinomycetota bacterium]